MDIASFHGDLRNAVADFYDDPERADHPVVRRLATELAAAGAADDESIRTVAAYATHMRKAGVYGSVLYELPILAELHNLRISVVMVKQANTGTQLGADLRDHVIEPPPRACGQLPLCVSLLYLNNVSYTLDARWTLAAHASIQPLTSLLCFPRAL
jgi:hypothetical protein